MKIKKLNVEEIIREVITEKTENMLSEVMDQKAIIVKWEKGIIYYKYENNNDDEVKSIKYITLLEIWRNI